jgi:hypothetical protein
VEPDWRQEDAPKPETSAPPAIPSDRFSWLTRGDVGDFNPIDAAAGCLKFDAYHSPSQQETGETMTTQTIANAGCRISKRAETMRDIALVASFGLWAMLLGAMPVAAFQLLMAN